MLSRRAPSGLCGPRAKSRQTNTGHYGRRHREEPLATTPKRRARRRARITLRIYWLKKRERKGPAAVRHQYASDSRPSIIRYLFCSFHLVPCSDYLIAPGLARRYYKARKRPQVFRRAGNRTPSSTYVPLYHLSRVMSAENQIAPPFRSKPLYETHDYWLCCDNVRLNKISDFPFRDSANRHVMFIHSSTRQIKFKEKLSKLQLLYIPFAVVTGWLMTRSSRWLATLVKDDLIINIQNHSSVR